MRTAAAAALTVLCVMPPAARAVDWSLRSTASETVELNNNMFLSPSPLGGTLGSYSSISANAEARTATSRFDFDSHVNYSKYWGPGASTLPTTENLGFGFAGVLLARAVGRRLNMSAAELDLLGSAPAALDEAQSPVP